jgi:hypothetical protein
MLDRIEANRAARQGGANGGGDILEGERFQQTQNLHELPLASLQAGFEQPAQHTEPIGQLPARQRRRLVERTRLLLQEREVMQRVEDEVLAGVGAPVAGDLLAAADDLHPVDIAADQHRAVAVGGRDRVVIGAIAHQRQRADPTRSLLAWLVGHGWQVKENCLICRQTAPDRGVVTTQPIIEAAPAAGFELRVQLLEGRRPRQRHQIVAPGIADQILDLALVVALARAAEAILE